MLWRVRTTLPDRPGSLAALAQRCGESGVNILGLQIFPGVEDVTDELVVRTPMGWVEQDVAGLLEASGGSGVVVLPSREAALADQPTRYIRAVQMIIDRPMSFPDVAARLFETETVESSQSAAGVADVADVADVMEMVVGEVVVHIRRRTPFTATEHARGAALADLVSDVLRRSRPAVPEPTLVPEPDGSMGGPGSPEYVVEGLSVVALVDGVQVGRATVEAAEEAGEELVHRISLSVEPAWRRRGIGTHLLVDAARLARTLGADALVIATASDNPAVLPLVLAAGMRGLIRMSAGELTVRVPVHRLKPLPL